MLFREHDDIISLVVLNVWNPPSNSGSFHILAKFAGVRAGMRKMIEIGITKTKNPKELEEQTVK